MAATAAEPRDALTTDDSAELNQLLEAVRSAWAGGDEFSEQTRLRAGETVERFTRRVTRQGARTTADLSIELCAGFVASPTLDGRAPELTTQHARRAALRMYFRTARDLGVPVGDPTLDLRLPARTSTSARPLTDDEVALCRYATRLGQAGSRSLQRAVCWALAEATAITSEITQVRVGDIDDSATPRWVHLAGTKRTRERRGELTDWGSRMVARQIDVLAGQRPSANPLLTYRGRGTPGQHVAQAAVCNAIGEVLHGAGLSAEPDVRPASVRNWAARRLFDGGMPIEHVAVRMGARSLDAVAEDIGLVWWSP